MRKYLRFLIPSTFLLVAQGSTAEPNEEEETEQDSESPDNSRGFRRTMEADCGMGDQISTTEVAVDSSAASSSCPSWLRKELENAEFIPMPQTPSIESLASSRSDKETFPYNELKGLHMPSPTPVNINESKSESWQLVLDSAESCDRGKLPVASSECKCSFLQAEVERLSGLISKCLADQEKLQQETARLNAQLQVLSRRQGTHQLESHSKATQTSKEEMESDPKPDLDSESWCLLGTDSCRFSL
uniref:Uncharacterized protein n=1 Tax=Micrurus paraensis TaxID=1970185 RepID=A0A2D4KH62_9SAUR